MRHDSNDRNAEPTVFPVFASTHWDGKTLYYVRDIPRKIRTSDGKYRPMPGFADWEYTLDASQAVRLTRYWWRRFRSDSHYCQRCAHWRSA